MHSPSSSRAIHNYCASPSPFRSSSASLVSSSLCAPPRTLALNYRRKYLSVRGRRSDFSDQRRQTGRPPSPPPEEPTSFSRQPPGALNSKVFVGYSIYKGKAALTVEPRAPEFAPLDSGAYKVSKEGFMLLQFAPAVGNRQYDWSRKQVFSLSIPEIGHLMSLGAKDSCEFFHDPFKGRNEEGKIRKVLKVEPLPDGTGYFFNLSVQNRLLNMDDSIYIPISKPEFTILNSALNFIVPYLLGWHSFANAIKPENSFRLNNARFGADFEWGR
ncbi:single-stranded DNA-binding protein WHY1, chloroplastic-like [Zingiber officinale]|uniref:Single-stranded DNA-binding protein WHY1, chloroplastic n=1 Tax=Zingiber officinale TaxID=94328 RepID=A0A8J5FQ75_ZINOF|nr:single-stranded DNA-binding protein WHY1, chloroplastic-like [Zingiber officinale]KAG6491664.1 hypothetical protein ZIOFF_046600 [Zingiber officinale]